MKYYTSKVNCWLADQTGVAKSINIVKVVWFCADASTLCMMCLHIVVNTYVVPAGNSDLSSKLSQHASNASSKARATASHKCHRANKRILRQHWDFPGREHFPALDCPLWCRHWLCSDSHIPCSLQTHRWRHINKYLNDRYRMMSNH